jgi:hypothetical protein
LCGAPAGTSLLLLEEEAVGVEAVVVGPVRACQINKYFYFFLNLFVLNILRYTGAQPAGVVVLLRRLARLHQLLLPTTASAAAVHSRFRRRLIRRFLRRLLLLLLLSCCCYYFGMRCLLAKLIKNLKKKNSSNEKKSWGKMKEWGGAKAFIYFFYI